MSLSYSNEQATRNRRHVALRRRLAHLTTPPPYRDEAERKAWSAGYDQALRDIAARLDVCGDLR